jgi:hypothetical protein
MMIIFEFVRKGIKNMVVHTFWQLVENDYVYVNVM